MDLEIGCWWNPDPDHEAFWLEVDALVGPEDFNGNGGPYKPDLEAQPRVRKGAQNPQLDRSPRGFRFWRRPYTYRSLRPEKELPWWVSELSDDVKKGKFCDPAPAISLSTFHPNWSTLDDVADFVQNTYFPSTDELSHHFDRCTLSGLPTRVHVGAPFEREFMQKWGSLCPCKTEGVRPLITFVANGANVDEMLQKIPAEPLKQDQHWSHTPSVRFYDNMESALGDRSAPDVGTVFICMLLYKPKTGKLSLTKDQLSNGPAGGKKLSQQHRVTKRFYPAEKKKKAVEEDEDEDEDEEQPTTTDPEPRPTVQNDRQHYSQTEISQYSWRERGRFRLGWDVKLRVNVMPLFEVTARHTMPKIKTPNTRRWSWSGNELVQRDWHSAKTAPNNAEQTPRLQLLEDDWEKGTSVSWFPIKHDVHMVHRTAAKDRDKKTHAARNSKEQLCNFSMHNTD
eukprot:TRINITY_DN66958_c7_g1_i2.p1 TRINITY_DN66958_c7_g1~~TRINITY_DN66958_c7_g1_i2.p1  ORF type:complete len:452 (+),score=23.84 TRINITY_DN66958_c7_g1_i2:67-1422(+)